MIQLLPQLKIFLAYQPVDFRKLSMGWFHYAAINWRLILTTARFLSFEIDAARPSKF